MSGLRNYNWSLIGKPGLRDHLDTPALVLDLDALDANIATMQAYARAEGFALRPHAKTHKCTEIARRQMAAGAVGICCAKLGEAEAMAAGGIESLLLTSPVVTSGKIARLLTLSARVKEVMVVADDPANVQALAEAASTQGRVLDVLVDVDPGFHRFGAESVGAAVKLGQMVTAASSLRLRGLQGYAGDVQHIEDFRARQAESTRRMALLGQVRDAFHEADMACCIVTGGGTGTHAIDPACEVLTDLQVGSYVFSDVQYDRVHLRPSGINPFRNALFVYTRVVSSRHAGFATTDAGTKSFSVEDVRPVIVAGAPSGSEYGFSGDEFGRVALPDPSERLDLNCLIECVIPHCDPTLNLHDDLYVVSGDRLVDIWPIEARGAAG